jgi:acylphosphatase
VNPQDRHERLQATVRGTVQGVGFRWFVVREAANLELTGWTRNEGDGSVTVLAEGPVGALGTLERRLWQGPPGAAVSAVDSVRTAATGEFVTFSIMPRAHRGD